MDYSHKTGCLLKEGMGFMHNADYLDTIQRSMESTLQNSLDRKYGHIPFLHSPRMLCNTYFQLLVFSNKITICTTLKYFQGDFLIHSKQITKLGPHHNHVVREGIGFLWLLKQLTTNIVAQNNIHLLSYSSGGQKSNAGFNGLKPRYQKGWPLSGGSSEEYVFLPSLVSGGYLHSLGYGSLPVLKLAPVR